MARFAALPTWWIRGEPGLVAFEGGEKAGTSIASLKLMMALATLADFHTKQTKSSVSDLEKITGLSRPMVLRGIAQLEELEILGVDREGHVNVYELVVPKSDQGWAKLPYDRVRLRLPEFLNRGVVPLGALKVYLALAMLRPNGSAEIALSHEKLRAYTGLQKRNIRPALDILFSHSLIRLDKIEADNPKGRHNIYTLLGL